jgi:bilirubin oxidase
VPAAFAPLPTYDTSRVNVHRSIHISADTLRFGITAQVDGPFSLNQQPFDMDSINFRIPVNSQEIWTLTNSTWVAHPFHIHDVPFFILDKNGNPPPPQEAGWKDVVVVMPGSTVRFITKFETFADDVVPYMYHCHLLHHEDDGMMGQFLVLNPPAQVAEAEAADEFVLYPNPTPGKVRLSSRHPGHAFRDYALRDAAGRLLLTGPLPMEGFIDLAGFPPGIYHLIVRGARGDVAARVVKLPPN